MSDRLKRSKRPPQQPRRVDIRSRRSLRPSQRLPQPRLGHRARATAVNPTCYPNDVCLNDKKINKTATCVNARRGSHSLKHLRLVEDNESQTHHKGYFFLFLFCCRWLFLPFPSFCTSPGMPQGPLQEISLYSLLPKTLLLPLHDVASTADPCKKFQLRTDNDPTNIWVY